MQGWPLQNFSVVCEYKQSITELKQPSTDSDAALSGLYCVGAFCNFRSKWNSLPGTAIVQVGHGLVDCLYNPIHSSVGAHIDSV